MYLELSLRRGAGWTTIARDASLPPEGARARCAFRRRGAGANAAAMGMGTPARTAEPSDVALVQAIAADQDREAFALLFSRFAPRIKAHYARSLRSAAQSDDLVQDVMLSVWRNAQSYRPEVASVSTWIFRIARNRFIDVVRKQRFVDVDADDADAMGGREPPLAVDAALEVQELSARVEQALGEMPQEQAEVVRGSYFAHESASEMAERLRIPIGTVKSRMRAAMAYLHKRVFEGGQP
jgi:RNA polymerase sigma-70 factor (ECF subfamily)